MISHLVSQQFCCIANIHKYRHTLYHCSRSWHTWRTITSNTKVILPFSSLWVSEADCQVWWAISRPQGKTRVQWNLWLDMQAGTWTRPLYSLLANFIKQEFKDSYGNSRHLFSQLSALVKGHKILLSLSLKQKGNRNWQCLPWISTSQSQMKKKKQHKDFSNTQSFSWNKIRISRYRWLPSVGHIYKAWGGGDIIPRYSCKTRQNTTVNQVKHFIVLYISFSQCNRDCKKERESYNQSSGSALCLISRLL